MENGAEGLKAFGEAGRVTAPGSLCPFRHGGAAEAGVGNEGPLRGLGRGEGVTKKANPGVRPGFASSVRVGRVGTAYRSGG